MVVGGYEEKTTAMHIYIPSRGRHDRLATLAFIPSGWRKTLVVPYDELPPYMDHAPEGVDIVPCPLEGIAATRQWILENADDDHVFFADDDGRFFKRIRMSSARLTNIGSSPTAQHRMWAAVEDALHHIPLVGISYRSGNNHVTDGWYRDCTKCFSFWGVDRTILFQHDIRIDRTPVMEDFQVILSLLTRGYPNRVFFKWAWDQNGSNSAGGCSVWRTPEVQAEGAHMLHDMFPDFVKVVQKKPKSGWFNGQPRVDVNIQWKRAYMSHR